MTSASARVARAAVASTALVVALLSTASGTAVAQGTGPGAIPPPTAAPPLERLSTAIRPAVVGVKTEILGDIYLPDRTRVGSYSSTASCSGVGVGAAEGVVATDERCVGDADDSARILQAASEDLARQRPDRSAAAWLALLTLARVTVEAPGGGGGPTETVTVSGALGPSATLPARVVARTPPTGEHVALLRVQTLTLPTLELAEAAAPPDIAVTVAGYSAPDAASSPTTEPVYSEARTGTAAGGATPLAGLSTAMTRETTGGPTVDPTGRLIGVTNAGDADGSGSFGVAGAATLRSLAATAGLTLAPAAADRAFRAGVTAYYEGRYSDAIEQFDTVLAARPGDRFATAARDRAVSARDTFGDPGLPAWAWWAISVGAFLLLLVVVLLVVLAVRRRRRRTAPTPPAGAWPPGSVPPGPYPGGYGPPGHHPPGPYGGPPRPPGPPPMPGPFGAPPPYPPARTGPPSWGPGQAPGTAASPASPTSPWAGAQTPTAQTPTARTPTAQPPPADQDADRTVVTRADEDRTVVTRNEPTESGNDGPTHGS